MIKYINVDEVIQEVINFMSSYFDSQNSILDDTILYNAAREVMGAFRLNQLPTYSCLLEVNKNEAVLPVDFKYLCLAVACIEETHKCGGRFSETINTREEQMCNLEKCKTKCDYREDCDGKPYQIILEERFGTYIQRVDRYFPLSCSRRTKDVCDPNCFNLKQNSPYEIDINNGKITTNFNYGVINIEYKATLEGKDFKIPDHYRVRKYLKDLMIHEVLKLLYYNNTTEGIERKYHDSKRELDISYRNFINIIKTPEVNEYYQLARNMQKRYNSCNLWNGTYLEPGNKRSNPSLQRYTR